VSDAAHTALEARLNEARLAFIDATEADDTFLANVAAATLNDLLDAYIHLPLQRQGP
jgi:hypothetical protein